MGKASRLKRERKGTAQPTRKPQGNAPATERTLMVTLTKEAWQPVRLYYAIADRSAVDKRLRRLKCMLERPEEGCWEWLYEAESASLSFGRAGHDAVPPERRPVVLGRIRFPSPGCMTLQTNSTGRALAAVGFFASRLGAGCTPVRCRIVNRLFSAGEGSLEELMSRLDQDVTVRDLRSAPEREDAQHAYELLDPQDMPPVEDFQLPGKEDAPGFPYLKMSLTLRSALAWEHWQGHTELSMAELMMHLARQGQC